MAADWARVRREYADVGLREVDAGADPYALLERWLADALAAFDAGALAEPNAMALATVGPDGAPSVRTVLLKGLHDGGLCFYTNHDSRKGQDLAVDPRCAATLLWHELQRQVRVEGQAYRLPDEVSDAYFASRPRPAQLGAWASPQSRRVGDRAALEQAYVEVEERFAGQPEVPRPPHWGGWRVVPERMEFWHGRPGRMHDRVLFTVDPAGQSWQRHRLAP